MTLPLEEKRWLMELLPKLSPKSKKTSQPRTEKEQGGGFGDGLYAAEQPMVFYHARTRNSSREV